MRLIYLSLCLALASPVWAGEPPTAPILRIEAGMHTAMINRLDVDVQGQYVVTGSDDKTTRVWQRSTGQLLSTLRHPIGKDANEGKVFATAISPDGTLVAVAGWTKLGSDSGHTIYLFNRSSGQLLRRLTGMENVINHLAFSPDGKALAAVLGRGNGLRVFDPTDGRLLAADRDYADSGYGVAWSDSQTLATTSFDGKLRLYHVQRSGSNRLSKVAEYTVGGQPYGIAYSKALQQWAVGFHDSLKLQLHAASSLQPLATLPNTRSLT